jgi:4-carboxymuconolactone decarboxylase
MRLIWALAAALWVVRPDTAAAQDRMPRLPPEQLTEQQKAAIAAVAPRGNLPVYLVPLLRSPEVMTRVNGLGDYVVRGKTALDQRQTELVILLVIRHWSQAYMWSNHQQIAIKAGLGPEIVAAIDEGRRPDALAEDERALYDFCTELQQNQAVSDATYGRMVSRFGEQGVIDTIGLAGYYTVLSMTFNATRMPPTPGGSVLRPLP